jgi:hypothetical protein
LLLTVAAVLAGARPAEAIDWLRWGRQSDDACEAPAVVHAPNAAAMPGMGGASGYRQPNYRYWLDDGLDVPVYRWGYFGAKARPYCVYYHGFYGDYHQYSLRRGY